MWPSITSMLLEILEVKRFYIYVEIHFLFQFCTLHAPIELKKHLTTSVASWCPNIVYVYFFSCSGKLQANVEPIRNVTERSVHSRGTCTYLW